MAFILRMASFAQTFAGKKRESNLWKYLTYSPDDNKSKCSVRVEENECGFLVYLVVSGKNTTNLKAPLAHHPAIVSVLDEECKTKAEKRKKVIALPHPHTGDHLAHAIEKCLNEWDIVEEKVLMIVSDNGSKIIKATQLMNERAHGDEKIMDETVKNNDVMDQQEEGKESETS